MKARKSFVSNSSSSSFVLLDPEYENGTPETTNQDDSLYCSCGGPAKINTANFNIFYICTICKKEKK